MEQDEDLGRLARAIKMLAFGLKLLNDDAPYNMVLEFIGSCQKEIDALASDVGKPIVPKDLN
jgi:hypothetical protein